MLLPEYASGILGYLKPVRNQLFIKVHRPRYSRVYEAVFNFQQWLYLVR